MMRPALAATLLALTSALAGCDQPQSLPTKAAPSEPSDSRLSLEPIDAVPIKAEAAPKPSSTPAPAPAQAQAPADPPATDSAEKPTYNTIIPEAWDIKRPGIAPSCLAEIGETRSMRLVARCIAVSPATRPPCNSANPCDMIQGEIDRACALYGPDETRPKECAV